MIFNNTPGIYYACMLQEWLSVIHKGYKGRWSKKALIKRSHTSDEFACDKFNLLTGCMHTSTHLSRVI
jgi:hypothetical protein